MKCPECDGNLVLLKGIWIGRSFNERKYRFSVYRCENKDCEKTRNLYLKNNETNEPINVIDQPVAEQEIHIIERCNS